MEIVIGFKTSKTLTGIETGSIKSVERPTLTASKHLKPLQGLKQISYRAAAFLLSLQNI